MKKAMINRTGKKRDSHRLTAVSAGVLACGVMLAAGCSRQNPADEEQERFGTNPQEETGFETETYTELYEVETETDFFGDILLRSVWEIMPDEVRLWAAAFRAEDVERILYTTYMENDPETFEITDTSQIAEIFAAIDQMEAAGTVSTPAIQGDIFVFELKDGTSQEFSFSMTCIVVGGQAYETDHSALLWDLTGDIIFGEEDTEEDF